MADAAAEGATAFGALSDAVRKNAAFNALAKIYGPGGGAVQEFQSKQAQETAQTGLTGAQTGAVQAATGKTAAETAEIAPNAASTRGLQGAETQNFLASGGKTAAETAQVAPNAASTRALQGATTAKTTAETAQVAPTAAAEQARNRAAAGQLGASAASTQQTTNLTAGAQARVAGQQILGAVSDIYAKGGTADDALKYYDAQMPTVAKLNGLDPAHVASVRNAIAQGPEATKQASDLFSGATNGGGAGFVIPGAKGQPSTFVNSQTIDYEAQKLRDGKPIDVTGMGASAIGFKATVTQRAAQLAAAEGKTGDADVLNAQSFKARQAYVDDLAKSSPTSAGGLVRSAGALLEHASLMDQYIDASSNGNMRVANALAQEWKKQTGSEIPTQLDQQKTILGDETARYLISRGGGVTDREALQAPLSKANSPAQLRIAMQTIRSDVQGQLGSQRQQAVGLNAADQFDKQLTPRARALMGAQGTSASAAAGGWSNFRAAK